MALGISPWVLPSEPRSHGKNPSQWWVTCEHAPLLLVLEGYCSLLTFINGHYAWLSLGQRSKFGTVFRIRKVGDTYELWAMSKRCAVHSTIPAAAHDHAHYHEFVSYLVGGFRHFVFSLVLANGWWID